MESLRPLVEPLARGDVPPPGALEALGEPDPGGAGESLRAAATHPDLAASATGWLSALLQSARPGFGARALVELARRYREVCHRPLDLPGAPGLPGVLGSSDFLARLLLRHPNWADELAGDPPDAPAAGALEPDWTAIRIEKYRGLLRIAARDLLGRPFEQGLRELSDLADRCLRAGLACAARETGVEPPALLALGKLGGRELNFASDVDLLFVYESEPGEADLACNRASTKLIQTLKSHMERPGEDGFAYRVDLDLRPEGRSGVLANSVDAALTYYEAFGADWERQALIRLRPVAGPEATARALCDGVAPFVYRRLIGTDAIRSVHGMKARIEEERRGQGRDLERELKEGPGGIRDVEFLVQALQLFHGGRVPRLRTGNVADALAVLGELGLLPGSVAAELRDAYLWLRRAEHCLQLVEERQTHRFPADPAGQLALARRMGRAEPEGRRARDRLLHEWTTVRAFVRQQFEALVLRDEP